MVEYWYGNADDGEQFDFMNMIFHRIWHLINCPVQQPC